MSFRTPTSIPLPWLNPLRRGAVNLPRGSLSRSACVAALKLLSRNRRISTELTEIAPLDDDSVFEACDSMVLDAVYWFGVQGYEGVLGDLWKALCRRSSNVLEIGGNIGLYTILGAREMRAGSYTVVEPLPGLAAAIRRNLLRNSARLASIGVEVVEGAAVADSESRRVKVSIPQEGRAAPVGAHLLENVEIQERSGGEVIEVIGVPFCRLVHQRDLIKLDAEGIEYELLSSARRLISEKKPPILVEVLPEAENLANLIASLSREDGYSINVVPAWGTNEIVTVTPEQFTPRTPAAHNSKDVILFPGDLQASTRT